MRRNALTPVRQFMCVGVLLPSEESVKRTHNSCCVCKTWDNQVSDFRNAPPGLLRTEVKGHQAFVIFCADTTHSGSSSWTSADKHWGEVSWFGCSDGRAFAAFYLPDGLQITFQGFKSQEERVISLIFWISSLMKVCQQSWLSVPSCVSLKLIKRRTLLSHINPEHLDIKVKQQANLLPK